MPAKLPVGADINGLIQGDIGNTWNLNYKWKPEDLNTIDFAVYIDVETINGKRKDKISTVEIDDVVYEKLPAS